MGTNCLQIAANDTRKKLETWCVEHDGDMIDFFTDSIYGEDENGDLIIGFGVYGSANIVVNEHYVKCGGYLSRRFSDRLTKAMTEFISMLDNC